MCLYPHYRLSMLTRLILCGVASTLVTTSAAARLDPARYITLDEISTDMEAWCLTVLEGTKIEKFPLRIISVIRNYEPDRHAILVVGTDPRFIHAGAIHGCSGSPVYIDGRMAGALAAGWSGSKDPLYLATPIEEMLSIGTAPAAPGDAPLSPVDLSQPIDLSAVHAALYGRAFDAPLPLATSLSPAVCGELAGPLAAMGMNPIPAGAAPLAAGIGDDTPYLPGGVLAVPLITGDITMGPIGTITEVIGNTVYAFGHHFTGVGPIDLPMASGTVHTVVPGVLTALKFATPGPVRGAIRFDESAGIVGLTDAVAKTIPLRIAVDRFNDPRRRTYDCSLAVERLRTPLVLQAAIIAAVAMRGSLPPEHTIRYKGVITPVGFDPIVFENVSSGESYGELGSEALAAVGLLLNNPYSRIDIASLDFDIAVAAVNTRSTIRTVSLSDSRVRPGGVIDISVLLQSYMSQLSQHRIQIAIPEDLRPGRYEITIAGAAEYEKFIRKVAPHRFTAWDLPTLVETLDSLLTIRRDRLYAVMALPVDGLTIRRAELPMLPPTRAGLLSDDKRTVPMQRYGRWIENSVPVDSVVLGGRTVQIVVQE